MTLTKYLSYWEDNRFSFFLKFVLLQFKFIPAEFKYRRDSNGLKIQFRTLTKTEARIHFTSYVFMYLCLPMSPLRESSKAAIFNYIARLEGSFYVNSAVLRVRGLSYSLSCRRRVLTHLQRQGYFWWRRRNIRVCIWSKMKRPLPLSCDTSKIRISTRVGKITTGNCGNSFLKNIFVVPIQILGNSYLTKESV